VITRKEVKFRVYKPNDYMPITKSERKRITEKVMLELFDVANRFDGSSDLTLKVTFQAKGNA